jgi:deazaflavin-dependent oxidoreductase (nitroreductase family)
LVRRALLRAFVRTHVLAYRLTRGRVGSAWRKASILLLTTRGRKSAKQRTTPVLCLQDGARFVVVATNNGAPRHPAWYLNLLAHPRADVEVKGKRFARDARTAGAEERAELWPRLVAIYPKYERDQQRTTRELPVVILERT